MKRIDLKSIVYALGVFGIIAALGMRAANFVAYNADLDFQESIAPNSQLDCALFRLGVAKAKESGE